MFLIICLLNRAAALRLIDGEAHGIRHIVGVHDNMAFGISGRTANSLHEGGLRTEEAFFIRIQNRH